ncbi:MAG TPA: PTS sugar transporter subunit IIA [Stellaceae bacterium]|nr:PTS sugar transporter subunit IIA [Stellaceae bacterium]
MDITELLDRKHIAPALQATDKPALLRELSQRAARAIAIDPQAILEALQAREALGSTGVGAGIAIPHARVAGLQQFFGYFVRLQRPIAFDAIDGRPVDLVVLLLSPDREDAEPLAALACISRVLRNRDNAAKIRAAANEREIVDQLGLSETSS